MPNINQLKKEGGKLKFLNINWKTKVNLLGAEYNHCQISLEHPLDNVVYVTVVSLRLNLTTSDPLSP